MEMTPRLDNTKFELRPIRWLIIISLILHLVGLAVVMLPMFLQDSFQITFSEDYFFENYRASRESALVLIGPETYMFSAFTFAVHLVLAIGVWCIATFGKKRVRIPTAIFLFIITFFTLMVGGWSEQPVTPMFYVDWRFTPEALNSVQTVEQVMMMGYHVVNFAMVLLLLPTSMLWFRNRKIKDRVPSELEAEVALYNSDLNGYPVGHGNIDAGVRTIKKFLLASLILHLVGLGVIVLVPYFQNSFPIAFTTGRFVEGSETIVFMFRAFVRDIVVLIIHVGLVAVFWRLAESEKRNLTMPSAILLGVATLFMFFGGGWAILLTELPLYIPYHLTEQVWSGVERNVREIMSMGGVVRDLGTVIILIAASISYYRSFMRWIKREVHEEGEKVHPLIKMLENVGFLTKKQ